MYLVIYILFVLKANKNMIMNMIAIPIKNMHQYVNIPLDQLFTTINFIPT